MHFKTPFETKKKDLWNGFDLPPYVEISKFFNPPINLNSLEGAFNKEFKQPRILLTPL